MATQAKKIYIEPGACRVARAKQLSRIKSMSFRPMLRQGQKFLLFLLILGCVEPYEFVIKNAEPTLVVEAFISDKSFNETVSYPSDGRYFTVRLTTTTDVINVRPVPVRYAYVQLLSDRNEAWDYVEGENPGYYFLFNDDFKAEAGVNYKLTVKLSDGAIYESGWETLPTTNVPVMGDITFKEESIQKYGYHLGEQVLETVKGIWTQIVIPDNTTEEPLNYRWTYTAHWEFVAALSSPASRGHRCWVTNPLEIRRYAIQQDRRGGYNKDLYFLETIRNDKIFERYSSLIVQHAMTKEFYTFWKEMKEQNEGGAILDKPPFNLETNFHSVGEERKVSGYFGVVQEQARRWYFERSQLSYRVDDPSRTDCAIRYQPEPPPECFSCLLYRFGISTNVKPEWWED